MYVIMKQREKNLNEFDQVFVNVNKYLCFKCERKINDTNE